MDQSDESYYTIGKVSKLCNIPIRTLHYYNDIGLLTPGKVDPFTNYRYYSREQLSDINIIKHFKKAGFSLKEIQQLIERKNLDYNEQMIKSKCQEIEKMISDLTILKNRLMLYIGATIPKDLINTDTPHIEIREIPVSVVAYLRYTGVFSPEEFSLRFLKLSNIIEQNNLPMAGTLMAIYYDDYRNFDYSNADIEVCTKVAESEVKEGITRKFGGFLAAVVMHYGSYKTMNHTYAKTLDWLEKNGFSYVGGAIENYIIDLVSTVYEDDYVTEIILPIKKIS